MTKVTLATVLVGFLLVGTVVAQETPSATEMPTASPAPTASATESPISSPAPTSTVATPIATPPVVRSVRLSFLPPPLQGKISLGIYDANGQLVRILHREAELDQFTIGADALVTKWDGKNDKGEDLPSGKYHARGYLVAPMKIEQVSETNETMFIDPPDFIPVKLIPNPLESNNRPVIKVAADLDAENVFLKADGLPILTIAKTADLMHTDVALTARTDKSLDIFVREGPTTREFHIIGTEKMMAFDCGDFELK